MSKISKKAIALGSGLALLAVAGSAFAFGGPGRHFGFWSGEPGAFPGMQRVWGMGPMGMGPGLGKRLFRMADADGDGAVTLEEATKLRLRPFQRFDLNGDGLVSADEALEAIKKRLEPKIRRLVRTFDENGDGKVSRDEFTAPTKERFSFLDFNGDGKITRDELPFPRPMKRRGFGWRGGAH